LRESAPFAGGNFRIANPDLGPEEQEGWDAGVDFVFGDRGSLSATYYDQIARGLIQQVTVALGPPSVFQNQNVGRVKNKGLELDGTFNVGPARLRGQFALTHSRIETLAAGFTGDLRVGDRPLAVPKYTAGASLAVFPQQSMTVTAGLTYVGSFVNYDFFARTACQGGTGPCRSSNRDYLTTYPSFAKVDVSVTRQLTRSVSAFVSVQNAANKSATEFANTIPAMGRLTTIGFEARH
jgi:iron complex outermembrane receptor protein